MELKIPLRDTAKTTLAGFTLAWMLISPGHIVDYMGKVKVPHHYGTWFSQNQAADIAPQKPLHKYSF